MTKKYKNEWDVHLRDSYGEDVQVVRVEATGTPQVQVGFLFFQIAGQVATALFPVQNVAKVIRVEEELSEEGPFEQSDGLLITALDSCRTGCGCA